MKICHITTVHPRFDTRIFYKECQSLQKAGFDVSLIVADGKGDEVKDNIKIFDIGKPVSRKQRILNFGKKAFEKAMEINAEIYHFHDPELITIGLKLHRKAKKVIYDVHEDLPRQMLGKPYLKKFLRKIFSVAIEKYETYAAKRFSYIITATDFIKRRFFNYNHHTEAIKNYPIIENTNLKPYSQRENIIVYAGLISRERGIKELIKVSALTDYKVHIAGKFINNEFENEIKAMKEWKNVVYHGFLSRNEINKLLNNSKIGMVTLYPLINYNEALPVKLFEYMSFGLPVIVSNIKLWRKIVEEANCGVSADPKNVEQIAEKINFFVKSPEIAESMGKNGRKAIIEKYNWLEEEKKLLNIYETLK